MSITKVYVLNEAMSPDAPIYQRINKDQRQRINKLPWYVPYLQVTFTGEDNKNYTIRYKQNANTIYQDEQIKANIPANTPFTSNERKGLAFRNGVLTTKDPMAIMYLDAYPANEKFKGSCADITKPEYKEYNKVGEAKIGNEAFKKRVKAANKIATLNDEDAKELLIRLNGSFFEVPFDTDEKMEMLINYLDNAESEGLDLILQGDNELNEDVKATILIGKLLLNNLISFDEIEGQVAKKDAAGKWVAVKSISADTLEEKKRLFSDYILSNKGEDLLNDLSDSITEFEQLIKKVTTSTKNKN